MALRMSQMLRSSKELRGGGTSKPPGAQPRERRRDRGSQIVTEVEDQPDLEPLFEEATPTEETAGPVVEERVAVDDRSRAEVVYDDLVAAAQDVFTAAETHSSPDGPSTVAAVRAALNELGCGDFLLSVTVRRRSGLNSLAERSTNVAILAMRVGMELDYDERRGSAVGLCGLMHDVGMLTISEKVLAAQHLNDRQVELLHRHPMESQKMIHTFGEAFHWIGKIVLQIHERQDGSGYPKGLRGEQIHEFARVIGLVDTYEAMAQPRADRKARVIYNALKEIINLRNSLFERRLIRALINIVSIFPLGSLVRLNNSEIGRVVGTSRTHPTRPSVDILMDPQGKRLEEPRHLYLEEEPMLYIVDPAIEESVLEKGRS